jgi:glucose-6-phosphate isomerase
MFKKFFLSKNFYKKSIVAKDKKKIIKLLNKLLTENNEVVQSLRSSYKNSFKKKQFLVFKKFSNVRLIGMGGSILGAKAIYDFLKHKIKKKFTFIDNLEHKLNQKNIFLNIIISKSGNTIETIVNSNILMKNRDKNIFITENKKSYLQILAKKLKAEIVHHNNYIGGRYSVLSEVGMLPAELMGLNSNYFKQLNSLIQNKYFFNQLVDNVSSIYFLSKKKKFNSVIINYDEQSNNFFKWYQQLVAESLGKKKKGFLPIISSMPKDNHSMMQLYLDGIQNNFYTIFYVNDNGLKINNSSLISTYNFLKNKSTRDIAYAQKKATENVFLKKNIPFRSFEIDTRNEKILGKLFSFFILETILLGRMMNVNPFDQPEVELIKQETKKILLRMR